MVIRVGGFEGHRAGRLGVVDEREECSGEGACVGVKAGENGGNAGEMLVVRNFGVDEEPAGCKVEILEFGGGEETRGAEVSDCCAAVGVSVVTRFVCFPGRAGGTASGILLNGRAGGVGRCLLGYEEDAIVVFEVLANAGEVVSCRNGVCGELCGGPNAGEEEEFGGVKGASGEDYVFVGVDCAGA